MIFKIMLECLINISNWVSELPVKISFTHSSPQHGWWKLHPSNCSSPKQNKTLSSFVVATEVYCPFPPSIGLATQLWRVRAADSTQLSVPSVSVSAARGCSPLLAPGGHTLPRAEWPASNDWKKHRPDQGTLENNLLSRTPYWLVQASGVRLTSRLLPLLSPALSSHMLIPNNTLHPKLHLVGASGGPSLQHKPGFLSFSHIQHLFCQIQLALLTKFSFNIY